MLNLDNCIAANRPCIFVVGESDIEILKYLDEKYNKGNYSVYSTTLTRMIKMTELLKDKFAPKKAKTESTWEVLSNILNRTFHESNNNFETFVFLNADNFINDKQNIRLIKDIITRYQLDTEFTVNLIFISQTINVPPDLERLSEVIFFDLPDDRILKEESDKIACKLELKKEEYPSDEVVNNLKGLTLFEVEQAYIQSWQMFKKIDLDFIRNFKKASIAKTDLLSLLETGVTFDSIGGLETLKKWVRKSYGGWTVEGRKYNLPLLKGVLMVGPPGTGKSLMMKAIGNEWGLPVINLDLSRVFSSRVGDSESNIRRILKIIENTAPCLCVVDEMEKSFAGSQSSTFSDSGVTARILAVFLTWMQDCEKPVFIAGTSNNILYLPPELISRFDEIFFVNLPQEVEREEIFKIHLKLVGRDPANFDIKKLASTSKDFTGREIQQVIKESLYDAFDKKEEVNTQYILNVLAKKTNITTTFSEQLKALYKWVGWDKERKDGVRARFASIPDDMDVARIQSEIDSIIGEIERGK